MFLQNKSYYHKYLDVSQEEKEFGIRILTVGWQNVLPGDYYPLGEHPERYLFNPLRCRSLRDFHLLYVTKGQGYFASSSSPRQLVKAGSIILLFPNEYHTYSPDIATGWTEYSIGFGGSCFQEKINQIAFTRETPVLHIGSSNELLHLFNEILFLAENNKEGSRQLISGIIQYILGIIYYKQKNKKEISDGDSEMSKLAKEIIRDRIEEPLRMEDVADMLKMGYSCFRRKFKEQTGISPAKYYNELRHEKIKQLLTTTDLSVSEISMRMSFENRDYFCTFFKKREGVTPGDYRNKVL